MKIDIPKRTMIEVRAPEWSWNSLLRVIANCVDSDKFAEEPRGVQSAVHILVMEIGCRMNGFPDQYGAANFSELNSSAEKMMKIKEAENEND